METKQKKRKVVVSVLALAGLVAFALFAVGGSLEPFAPPGPTMKTLDEVEPRIPIPASATPTGTFTINDSGSYYLTGDRYASGHGIIVDANDVTIDLMGFQLIGPGRDSGYNNGVLILGRSNAAIHNGTVRNFGEWGICASTASEGLRVICVRVLSNHSAGMWLRGSGHLVKGCTAADNGGCGINVIDGASTVTGSTAYNNQVSGISAHSGCMVTGNTTYNNKYEGIYAHLGCTVTGNTAYNNQFTGISVYSGCTVTDNTAYNNQGCGIFAHSGCTVTGNTAFSNQTSGINLGGIAPGAGNCLVDQNTAYNNDQAGEGHDNLSVVSPSTVGLNHAP